MPTPSDIYNIIQSGSLAISQEASSITPSAPIYLYEIDLSEIYPVSKQITSNNQPIQNGVFRIYNDINLYNITADKKGKVYWQNNYYYPFPIVAEGFEINTVGALPVPTFKIGNTTPISGSNSLYKYLRMQFQDLGDIAGAKFSRIKTFLKFLHPNNFNGNINPYSTSNIFEAELPRDIFYIDRKSLENKYLVEYQLASILDIENVVLPSRTILGTKCPFMYRGEGCLYECHSRVNKVHSGVYANNSNNNTNITLLYEAPPVETLNEELFIGEILKTKTDRETFSGLSYKTVGYDNSSNSFNQWSFTNITPNGTNQNAVNLLHDGLTATTALTISSSQSGIVTLSLTGEQQAISKIKLSSAATINHNFVVQFSTDNNNWNSVNSISGMALNWGLSGRAAGTYVTGFRPPGKQAYYRIYSTSNPTSSSTISELNFSGEYRVGDSGAWALDTYYQRGNYVYLNLKNINNYFVCISGHRSNVFNAPPNKIYWAADICTKTIGACRRRWRLNPFFRPVLWPVTRGGWSHGDMERYYRYLVDPATDSSITGYSPRDDGLFPRRPDVRNPVASNALGIPKDYTGDYLNTFLPFGGFPGVNKRT